MFTSYPKTISEHQKENNFQARSHVGPNYVPMCVCVCVCECVYMGTFMHECVCVCVCVCVCTSSLSCCDKQHRRMVELRSR